MLHVMGLQHPGIRYPEGLEYEQTGGGGQRYRRSYRAIMKHIVSMADLETVVGK